MKLQARAIEAAEVYLESKGLEIIGNDGEFIFAEGVALIVIAQVNVVEEFGSIYELDRPKFEKRGMQFLKDNPEYVNRLLRFDEISLVVCGSNRAMLRHLVNCLG